MRAVGTFGTFFFGSHPSLAMTYLLTAPIHSFLIQDRSSRASCSRYLLAARPARVFRARYDCGGGRRGPRVRPRIRFRIRREIRHVDRRVTGKSRRDRLRIHVDVDDAQSTLAAR